MMTMILASKIAEYIFICLYVIELVYNIIYIYYNNKTAINKLK